MSYTNIPEYFFALPDYKYFDSPYSPDPDGNKDEKYITRGQIEERIRARVFTKTNSNAGSTIVTGFRGSGKSSVVRKVINQERAKDKNIWFAELNLAQDDIDEKTILKLVASELKGFLEKADIKVGERSILLFIQLIIFPVFPVSILFWADSFLIPECVPPDNLQSILANLIRSNTLVAGLIYFLLFALFALALPDIVRYFQQRYNKNYVKNPSVLLERLESVLLRMESSVTEETQRGITGVAAFNPFNIFKRRQVQFRNITIKEVELEIVDLLRKINSWPAYKRPKVVFLVDELDKLVPNMNSGINDKDSEDPTDDFFISHSDQKGLRGSGNELIRRRQEMIARLFANLKHFLNVAEAKFIFIGGRELFDAILADTSNRDPFFGSIFYDSIYVPSFLKEELASNGNHVSGLTTTTEHFLARALVSRKRRAEIERSGGRSGALLSLKDYFEYVSERSDIRQEEIWKAYVVLNEFLCYLTFRSNGIPKKVVKLFESHLTSQPPKTDNHLVVRSVLIKPDDCCDGPLYLHFDETSQYANHLLNNFYKPFISKHSRYYSALNDMQLVSFTYVLDHIFKYHSISFNARYLELTPELVAINKVPEFRKFISYTMDVLLVNHIRLLQNGLFNYQFYRKTSLEISYLSKVSDTDSAAMNFTLDESLPLKQHYYKRLLHFINLYSRSKPEDHKSPYADGRSRMIIPLYEWLGDLHYFDGEFDEASAQYRSAASGAWDNLIAIVSQTKPGKVVMIQNLLYEYTKLQLKRILCLDKMRAYEDAHSLNVDLVNDVVFICKRNQGIDLVDTWRLYLICVCNTLTLKEKSSYGGIRIADVEIAEEKLKTLLSSYSDSIPRLAKNIRFGFYDYLGQILYYKNWSGENLYVGYYILALRHLLQNHDDRISITTKLLEPEVTGGSSGKRLQIANFLTRLSDAIIDEKQLEGLTKTVDINEDFNTLGFNQTGLEKLQFSKAIFLYLLSESLYNKAGNKFRANFQLKKALFLLLLEKRKDQFTNELFEELVKKAKNQLHEYQSHGALPQLKKFEYQLSGILIKEDGFESAYSYSSEALELSCIHEDYRLLTNQNYEIGEIFWQKWATRSVTKFSRLALLKLKLKNNQRQLKKLAPSAVQNFEDLKSRPNTVALFSIEALNGADTDLVTELICDSIYCATEAIKILELFGTSLISLNSSLCTMYSKLGDWTFFYHLMNPLSRAKLNENLSSLTDRKIFSRLHPVYHYSNALTYLEKAYEQHNDSKSYKKMLEDMFFLEDDYSDNLVHFSTAYERLFLNKVSNGHNNYYKHKRDQLNDMVRKLSDHKYRDHFRTL